ncbi:MAG: two-component system, OmpR family, sensor histidine kinase PrrB [Solirubrobacteraceae bacterium]|nr:two-component system, OmpR family, sensor histidine kinase PrrB [Solirubrobacteraceae bacterium]
MALSGVLAGALLVAAVERDGRRAVDADLRARVARIAPPRRDRFDGGPRGARGGEPLLAGSGTFAQVSLGGQVVDQGGDVPSDPPAVPADNGYATVRIAGQAWRSLTVSLASSRGDARLQLVSSLAPVEARAASLRRLVVTLGLAALAITALAAWAFTTVAVRPLARLRAGAAQVSGAEDLRTPLPDDEGPVEVRSLARALNEMLARLETSTTAMQRALQATRRFASDAGHELRTPLTALRANLDALARNPGLAPEQRLALLADMTAEQDRIVHLLEGLQALARGDAAESLPREDVELGDVVDAALYAARRRHPAVRYVVDDGIADATVRGWGSGLRLLVDNLLDNAALHGRPHGEVRVGLAHEDGALVVRVEDDGPGIPAADRERVLERFARGPGATAPGTGLGLAIVAQQVALHAGALALGDSALGGLAVTVRLPVAAQSRPVAARARPAPAVSLDAAHVAN